MTWYLTLGVALEEYSEASTGAECGLAQSWEALKFAHITLLALFLGRVQDSGYYSERLTWHEPGYLQVCFSGGFCTFLRI